MSEVTSYRLTGDWRHIVEDGLVDLDDLPDEALPTGHVEFIPLAPQVAVSGSPETAYTLGSFKALIAGGVLRDLQGREGVQIAGKVGDTPVYWRAVTYLEYKGLKIPYPTVEFTLDSDARLTGIIASEVPGESATIYHPRIEALITELDSKSDVGHIHQITDVEGLQQALEDAAYSGGGGGDGGSGGPVSWTSIRNKPNTFPPSSHSHPLGDVSGLQAALDAKVGSNDPRLSDARDPKAHTHSWASLTGKPSLFPPEGHAHSITDISGLQQALEDAANSGSGGGEGGGGPVSWISVTGKPSEFPPESHTHLIRDVSGLQGALDEKIGDADPRLSDARTPRSHTHYWSEVTGKPLSYPPASHQHPWSEITGKPSTFNPASHSHVISDTTGLQDELDEKVDTDDPRLSDARTPTAHTHAISEVSGLQGALDSKAETEHGHQIEDVDGLQAALDAAAGSGGGGTELAPGIIETEHLADDSVTTEKIAPESVDAEEIAADAIRERHLLTWAVTRSKLHGDVQGELDGLRTDVDSKSDYEHGHTIEDVSGLQAALDAASGGEGGSGTTVYLPGAPWSFYWSVPDPVEGDVFLDGNGIVWSYTEGSWDVTGSVQSTEIGEWQLQNNAVSKAKLSQALQDEINGKVDEGHTHTIGDVSGLQDSLDSKVDDSDPRLSDARTPTAHTHPWGEVTDKPTTFPAEAHTHSWASLTGKPTDFPPAAHGHQIEDVNGLQNELDSKLDAAGSATTVWSGTQSEYDALPEATRHAVGFIGVIV